MNLENYDIPEILVEILLKSGTTLKSIDEVLSSSLHPLATNVVNGRTTIHKLETLEDMKEFATRRKQGQYTNTWSILAVTDEDLENILEFARIYQLGLERDRENKERLEAEEAERFARERAEAEAAKHPLTELGLSTRVFNALCKWGRLRFVEDIFQMTQDELLALRYFGQKGYDELRSRLIEHGFADPNAEGILPIKNPDELKVLRIHVTMDEILGKNADQDPDDEEISPFGKALKEALEKDRLVEIGCQPEE